MKVNTMQTKNTRRTLTPEPFQIQERHSHRRATTEEHQAFIREMNEFVATHGTITDDDYFRVL